MDGRGEESNEALTVVYTAFALSIPRGDYPIIAHLPDNSTSSSFINVGLAHDVLVIKW